MKGMVTGEPYSIQQPCLVLSNAHTNYGILVVCFQRLKIRNSIGGSLRSLSLSTHKLKVFLILINIINPSPLASSFVLCLRVHVCEGV